MAVVGVVRAVADAPAVVRHQDRGVRDVANQVVERLVVGKALVATVDTMVVVNCEMLWQQ